MLYTACFTGHRPQSLPCGFDETHQFCIKIKKRLKKLIIALIEQKNITHFISGMALGVDMWAAEIVLELKEKYPDITLEAALPCRSQTYRWNAESKERYNRILSLCDKAVYISEAYTKDCMMKRNKYMVDSSCCVIAVWSGKPGGTCNTVKYAGENNKIIYCIDTSTFKIFFRRY